MISSEREYKVSKASYMPDALRGTTVSGGMCYSEDYAKQYQDRISYLEKELRKLKGIIKQLEEQIETLKEERKRTGLEKNSLSEYIKTYTYPDIANRLLMDDGLVEEKDNTVDPVRLDKNIIGSGTVINFKEATEAKKKSASAAINSLFEELED